MNVARLHAPGDLRIEDAPVPEAGRGELVIRVRTCSTCGTDAKIFRFGRTRSSWMAEGTAHSARFNMSGSLAMFDATRLASSIVICFASMASASV